MTIRQLCLLFPENRIVFIGCVHCGTTGRSSFPCRLLLVWEERAALAKLKEKVINEGGRAILRIEEEEWKVVLIGMTAAWVE